MGARYTSSCSAGIVRGPTFLKSVRAVPRRFAARARPRRVAVEVQHSRAFVALATPRRPSACAWLRQFGASEPGHEHSEGVPDPKAAGSDKTGQFIRRPASRERLNNRRGEPLSLAFGQQPSRAPGGEVIEELLDLRAALPGKWASHRNVARLRGGGSLMVPWWI